MKSRRELAEQQLALMNDIRAKANINIVTCGYCGTVLLHSMLDDSIVCYSNKCKDRGEMNLSDCPDLWYDGCIENMIFDDEPIKEEPIKETPPTSQCGNQHTFDKVKEVIQILKTLDNGDCVDGETMQYILGQVGMEKQMLKQLVMENDYKVTKDLMREKFELDL